MYEIRFPNLGIEFNHVGTGINIGGFEIMFYGIVIAFGFLLGMYASGRVAKKIGIDPEAIFDYVIVMIIPSIIGARLYYVIFSWDYYKNHLGEIINTRGGGLAIYGGIIAAVVVLLIFCRKKKINFFRFSDAAVVGLLIGQILGRWGNFFNREAFGGFTNGPFAMQIPTDYFYKIGRLSEVIESGLYDKAVYVEHSGHVHSFIQVHPTFLYEGMWNLGLLLLILLFLKFRKFDGQLFAIYVIGYGIGRFWIEGLRTDQLLIPGIHVPASQVVAVLFVIFGVIFMTINMKKIRSLKN